MGGIGAIVRTMSAVSNRVQRCSKSVIFILCSIGLPQAIVLPFITAGMLLERGMTLLVGFRIASKADGNPLFVEELTCALVESGALVREPAGYRLRAALTALNLPATVQGVLL